MISDTSCAQCRELLIWYASNQLAPAEHARIAHHLAGCADCRAELAQWRKVATVFTATDELPPDHEAAATWGKLLTHLPPSPHHNNNGKATRGFSLMEFDAANTDNPVVTPLTTRDPKAPAKRQRTLLAPVAALLLVLLGVIVFTVLRPQLTQKATTPLSQATSTLPATPTINLPKGWSISAGVVTGPVDAWAVGKIAQPFINGTLATPTFGAIPPPPTALILHYSGGRWLTISSTDFPQSVLTSIAMISPNEGWAGGETNMTINTGTPGSSTGYSYYHGEPFFLHYLNGHWSKVVVTAQETNIDHIQMISATTGIATALDGSALFRYNDGTWSLDKDAPGYNFHMTSPDDIWSVNATTIWHNTAGQWTRFYTLGEQNQNDSIVDISVASATNIWVQMQHVPVPSSRLRLSGVGAVPESFFLHYDGHTWQRVNLASGKLPPNTFLNGFVGASGWAIATAQISNPGAPSYVLHLEKDQWQLTKTPSGNIEDIFNTSPNESWGVITSQNGSQISIIHYINGTWSV